MKTRQILESYLGGYIVKMDVPKVLKISTAPELYETPTMEQSADQATRRQDGNGSTYTGKDHHHISKVDGVNISSSSLLPMLVW